jgi:uncharacterized repeat protein (TIGR02543 family)
MKLLSALGLAMLTLGLAPQAISQVIVANNSDSGAGSLRQAIIDAAPGSVITFAPALSGQTIRLTSGELVIGKNVTINGSALPVAISVSGDADGEGEPTVEDSRVFVIQAGSTVILDSLRIVDGKAADGAGGGNGADGGGILNNGTLTIRNSTVISHSAGKGNGSGRGGHGGGIYNGGALTLERTVVSQNLAGDGGFGGNDSGGDGGGVYNAGTLIVKESTFDANHAGDAGNNGGTGGFGGGLYHVAGTSGIIENTTFSDNLAGSGGLGSGNGTGGFGGGIYSAGKLTLENSTVSGNQGGAGTASGAAVGTGGSGGGIANIGALTLRSVTVAGNITGVGSDDAGSGGGIFNDLLTGVLTLDHVIVAANNLPASPGSAGGPDFFKKGFSAIIRSGVNLIGSNSTVSTEFPSPVTVGQPNINGDLVGTNASRLNPKLTPLGLFGGPTETLVPLPDSPAVDPPGGSALSSLSRDQRGLLRVGDGNTTPGALMDIGAVEFEKAVDIGPGTLTFARQPSSIIEGAGLGQVGISRNGGARGAVSVRVDSSLVDVGPGFASSADFEAVTNFVVHFAHGESLKFVPVTITADKSEVELNEIFDMFMSAPVGGVTIGTPNPGVVRIIDAVDSSSPVLTLTSPLSNQLNLEANGAVFNVTGQARDNQGIERVEMSLDGGAYQEISITQATDLKSATFNVPLTVSPGPHSVSVRAIDTKLKSSAVIKRTFTYRVERPLTVGINDSLFGSVSPGFVPSSTRNVGFPYSITATPKPGYVFDGWTVNAFAGTGITVASAELPKLNFVMQPGLTLTANFRLNPFVLTLIGSFEGLVLPDAGQTPGIETIGHLTATVSSKGGVSGRLRVDGSSLTYSGTFDNSGVARFGTARSKVLVIKRKAKADLELELKLDMTGASKEVTGTLTRRLNGSQLTVSKIVAKRAHYSSVLKADVALAGAVSQRYHVILPSKAQAPVLAANLYPQGTGIGNFVVKPVGSISCSLKLADNTVVPVWAAKLTEANTFTVFGALYSSKGCFAAEIKVDPTQMDTDASGVDAVWCRPAITTSQWYPAGWPAGVNVDVVGSKYGAVTGTSVVPDLGPEDLTLGNVDLGFSDGLTAGINKLVNVSIADKLTRVPVTDTTFTAAITRSTGGVKGTFIHPSGSKSVAWEATLFQKAGAYQGGHGFFLSPLPKPVTGLGESGKVQFKESGKVQFKAK